MNLECRRCGGSITIADASEANKLLERGACPHCGGELVRALPHLRMRPMGASLRQLYLAWVNYGRAYSECVGGCVGDARPTISEPYEEIGRSILMLLAGPSEGIDTAELRRKTMANGKGHGLDGEEFK